MTAIVVTVDFHIRPGEAERWLSLTLDHLRVCVAEPGMLRFWVQRDTADPAHFLFYEEWARREDLDASMAASWRTGYVRDTEPLWAAPRRMLVHERLQMPWEPLDAGGVPAAQRRVHPRPVDEAIIVAAELQIRPQHVERWIELMRRTHGPIGAAEPGILRYWIHRDADDPAHLLLYEEWADRADFETSMRATWWREPYLADTEPLWARPRRLTTYRRTPTPWEPLHPTGLPLSLAVEPTAHAA